MKTGIILTLLLIAGFGCSCSIVSLYSDMDMVDLRRKQAVMQKELERQSEIMAHWHDAQIKATCGIAETSGTGIEESRYSPHAPCGILKTQCRMVKSLQKRITDLKLEMQAISEIIKSNADSAK